MDLSMEGDTHGLHQLTGTDIFEQIALRPGANSREDFVILTKAGQDDHLRTRGKFTSLNPMMRPNRV